MCLASLHSDAKVAMLSAAEAAEAAVIQRELFLSNVITPGDLALPYVSRIMLHLFWSQGCLVVVMGSRRRFLNAGPYRGEHNFESNDNRADLGSLRAG